MRKKLHVEYNLTIRKKYQELIPIVAKMQGCPDEIEDKEAFLQEFIKDLMKREVQLMIKSSLDQYFGQSQAMLIEQAMIDYDGSAELLSEISEVKE